MISTLSFSYPWWYMLFCLALGIAYGVLMYFRDKRFSEYSAWLRRGLAIIRSLGVALISLLLLSPFIRTIKEDIKTPLIVIANDVSESILEDGKKNNLDAFNKNMQQLATDLSSKYEVKRISFGSDVYADARDTLNDKSTNISNLFRHIADNYGDQNLGAVVMTSDGIYNEGSNPLYSDVSFTAPLYTIALGDTLQKKDIFIQNVLYNKIAYLGDKFPVQVDVSAFNCDGSNSRLTLEMINGTQVKKIAEESILLKGQSFYTTKTFLLDASQSGVVRYRLRLSAVPGEFNSANNVKEL